MSRFSTNELSRPSATAGKVEATIGIDFGTSSTKVAFREFGGMQSVLVPPSTEQIVWPSIVAVSEGALFFGTEAEQLPNVQVIRWLKMLLAADEESESNEYREEVRRARRETGCSVLCLATLYLANLLARVTSQMEEYYRRRGLSSPHLTINMGAPLETFGGAEVGPSGRFEEALFWAQLIAPQVPRSPGWPLKLALAAFDDVVANHPAVPTAAFRTTFVVPETHAAVTGAIIDRRRLPAGNYVVVDIGAGTTDVAVFSYSDHARKQDRWAVTYLADAVKHEASVQVDRCLSELVWEAMGRANVRQRPDAEMLELARQAKEQSATKDPVLVDGRFGFSRKQIDESVSELKSRLFDHYKRTVITALKDKTKHGLEQPFHLLMLGGGSRFAPLHDQFVHRPPNPSYASLKPHELWGTLKERVRVLHSDGTLRNLDGADDYRMYSLVHGLTTHTVRLADFWTPSEVEAFPAPPPADRTPYVRNDDD